MYSAVWSPDLRTGDVIGPIFLPLLGAQFEAVANVTSLGEMGGTAIDKVLVGTASRFVMVVSHDCEFNEGKRNKLLVAPLQDVPGNLSPEQLVELRASNDIEARHNAKAEVAGVDSFIIPPVADNFDAEQIVSFTTVTPLPMKMRVDLLNMKRAELEHEARLLLRRKLAWFFLRTDEDIPEEQKSPPPIDGNGDGVAPEVV